MLFSSMANANPTCFEQYKNAIPKVKLDHNQNVEKAITLAAIGSGILIAGVYLYIKRYSPNVGDKFVLSLISLLGTASIVKAGGDHIIFKEETNENTALMQMMLLNDQAYLGEGKTLNRETKNIIELANRIETKDYDFDLMKKSLSEAVVNKPELCSGEKTIVLSNLYNEAFKIYNSR